MNWKNRNIWSAGALALGLAFFSTAIAGDSSPVPFYYAQPTLLEPQIATLMIGVGENVEQAVVSPDRKYVTLDLNPSLLGSTGIQTFTYQKPGLGFVGSAAAVHKLSTPPGNSSFSNFAPKGNSLTPTIAALPSEIAPPKVLLDKPGMTLVAPLPPVR